MHRILMTAVSLVIGATVTFAESSDGEHAGGGSDGDKMLSGMSIVGNDEAPKSLVIVPWKSARLGDAPEVSRWLEDDRAPIDPEVFMRRLRFFEIRSGTRAK